MGYTNSSEGPVCPHCGRQYTADEPHYFDEMNYVSQECDQCKRTFAVSVNTTTLWACEPIDDALKEDR